MAPRANPVSASAPVAARTRADAGTPATRRPSGVAALVAIPTEMKLGRRDRSECDPHAFARIREQMAADIEKFWGGTFHRLGGPTSDPECALELITWLELTGRAYARDAGIALTPEWGRITAGRSAFLVRCAAGCHSLVALRGGVEIPSLDELCDPEQRAA